MPAAVPGAPNDRHLEKRIAKLELMLSRFGQFRTMIHDHTGNPVRAVILAQRNGKGDSGLSGAPFSKRSIKGGGEAPSKVTIWPGWVKDVLTQGGENFDAVRFLMPKYDGTELSSDDPPEIEMKKGDFLFVNYQTDKKGVVQDEPKVESSSEEKKTIHYQPVDGDGKGGVDGDYWIKIGKLNDNGEWESYQNSDIEHTHELPTFVSAGGGAKIFKSRKANEDSFELRDVKGGYGIKHEEGDAIKLDFNGENVGGGSGPVLFVPEGGVEDGAAAQLRTLRPMTTKEIQEEADGLPEGVTFEASAVQIAPAEAEGSEGTPNTPKNTLRVRGNGNHGVLRFVTDDGDDLGEVKFADGAWTSVGVITITIPTSESETDAPAP